MLFSSSIRAPFGLDRLSYAVGRYVIDGVSLVRSWPARDAMEYSNGNILDAYLTHLRLHTCITQKQSFHDPESASAARLLSFCTPSSWHLQPRVRININMASSVYDNMMDEYDADDPPQPSRQPHTHNRRRTVPLPCTNLYLCAPLICIYICVCVCVCVQHSIHPWSLYQVYRFWRAVATGCRTRRVRLLLSLEWCCR